MKGIDEGVRRKRKTGFFHSWNMRLIISRELRSSIMALLRWMVRRIAGIKFQMSFVHFLHGGMVSLKIY